MLAALGDKLEEVVVVVTFTFFSSILPNFKKRQKRRKGRDMRKREKERHCWRVKSGEVAARIGSVMEK